MKNLHKLTHAERVQAVDNARKAAHASHKVTEESLKRQLTAASEERDANLKSIDRAAAEAYESKRAQLERDIAAQLEPVCDAYRRDSRGATAEAVRTTWNALAARTREELGADLRIECLVCALFPTCTLAHDTNVVGGLRNSVSGAQSFADALRQIMIHSERGSSYVVNAPPSADEKAALTRNEMRALELKRERNRREHERARVAAQVPPRMPPLAAVKDLFAF